MSAQQTVTVKVDVDNTEALRKIRQVRREAGRLRRRVDEPRWAGVPRLACLLVAFADGILGIFEHSAYLVATACLLLLLADR